MSKYLLSFFSYFFHFNYITIIFFSTHVGCDPLVVDFWLWFLVLIIVAFLFVPPGPSSWPLINVA
jgi:hypothetical protein